MHLKDKRIFIVEDNMINRVTYQVMLLREGAFVEFDRWGDNCIPMLARRSRMDIIILDLMLMHGVNGYDLFKDIRAMPHMANVPIIAVSAAEPSEAIARCHQLGFNGYISKPIHEETFPALLAAAIQGDSIWSFS